jgi:hypothetical protein
LLFTNVVSTNNGKWTTKLYQSYKKERNEIRFISRKIKDERIFKKSFSDELVELVEHLDVQRRRQVVVDARWN